MHRPRLDAPCGGVAHRGGPACGARRYSVIDLHFVEEYAEVILRVRNPWGSEEWTGKYSDRDMADKPEMQRVLKAVFGRVTLDDNTEVEP